MENLKDWKTWLFLAVAAIVEWVVVHFLDRVGSGTAALWGWLLHGLSSGSKMLGSLPYREAAIDPLPTVVFLAMYLGVGLTLALIIKRFFIGFSQEEMHLLFPPFLIRLIDWINGRSQSVRVRSSRRALRYFGALLVFELVFTIVQVTLKAQIIRSAFNANREMIAPYITEQERLELQSQFAQMDTKEDFAAIAARMQTVASQHNIRLRSTPADKK